MNQQQWLPLTRAEMEERGWDRPDFCLVTGDAYIDHPSFGAAIISRVLESHGYKVAIIAQPDWHSTADFQRQHRLHGLPLYRGQAAAQRRCLHAGRESRQAAG